MNYAAFFSARAQCRKPSPIRALQPLVKVPGMLTLAAGFPNPQLFPFGSIELTLKNGTPVKIDGALLEDALQYSVSYGLPQLVGKLREHNLREHAPPSADWELMVTTGSQDALAKCFDLLVDEGDTVLTENPTYSGALSALAPYRANIVAVDSDEDGLIPDALASRLAAWPAELRRPRVLYTIPTGQNPSGSTLPLARRERLYQVACEHNLLIIEDDPYWDLRFDAPGAAPLRSLFSMDTQGRVLRLDSFSKILSSGFRVGWMSGPRVLVERAQLEQQATQLHASGISQALCFAVLNAWGEDGWHEHIKQVRAFYKERRDRMLGLLTKYLDGLATWHTPMAGMFVWLRLHGITDTQELIQKRALAKKVLMLPGTVFLPDGGKSPHVRASYSTASPENMEEAVRRFAELVKEVRDEQAA